MPENGAVAVRVVHKDQTYTVKLRWLPRAGELLRLGLKGAAEPLCFEVKQVVHSIEAEGSEQDIVVIVKASTDPWVTGKKRQLWVA
jgi:hypothetical protein